MPPLNGFPLELGIGVRGQKTRMIDGATGPIKKFDDIFRRLDTIHQRDRQTNRRTRSDSKERAYA